MCQELAYESNPMPCGSCLANVEGELLESQLNQCLTISVESAAKILGISRGLAYEMVRQGKIPALHFGRVIRIPRYALDQLLSRPARDRPSEEVAR